MASHANSSHTDIAIDPWKGNIFRILKAQFQRITSLHNITGKRELCLDVFGRVVVV